MATRNLQFPTRTSPAGKNKTEVDGIDDTQENNIDESDANTKHLNDEFNDCREIIMVFVSNCFEVIFIYLGA